MSNTEEPANTWDKVKLRYDIPPTLMAKTDSSKEFEHIGVDLAQSSDVQMVMVDGEQYILLAHHNRASQELVREAALSTLCPQCGATEAWHILNPDNHRSQAALPKQARCSMSKEHTNNVPVCHKAHCKCMYGKAGGCSNHHYGDGCPPLDTPTTSDEQGFEVTLKTAIGGLRHVQLNELDEQEIIEDIRDSHQAAIEAATNDGYKRGRSSLIDESPLLYSQRKRIAERAEVAILEGLLRDCKDNDDAGRKWSRGDFIRQIKYQLGWNDRSTEPYNDAFPDESAKQRGVEL